MKLPELPDGFVWGDTDRVVPDIRRQPEFTKRYVLVYDKSDKCVFGYMNKGINEKTFATDIETFEEAAPLMAQLLWLGQLECDVRGDPV